MNTTKTLKLKFHSDWHIGSGTGIPGCMDRQVLRDEGGLPYVPGKTLTGILRDAAEWVAHARDSAEKSTKWTDALVSLLGGQNPSLDGTGGTEARPAAIGIGSAEFSREIQDYFSERKEIIPMLFITQPGVKIDPTTGCSLEEHLFSTEKVRKGCTLYAPIKYDRELTPDEEKLLCDARNAVRRIGGKRRRGGGKCSLELCDANAEPSNDGVKELPNKAGEHSFVTLNFRLTTIQPVIINKVTLGNVVKSETIIPGAALLPYFTKEVFKLPKEGRIQTAVMNGEFFVSNFLPEIDGRVSYPVPLSFTKEKEPLGESKKIYNRLVELSPPKDGKTIQMKDVRAGYLTLDGENVKYHPSGNPTVLRTHNTVEDKTQRPTENVGGLFTYEAIKEDSVFRGSIRLSSKLWNEILENPSEECSARLCTGNTSIGQSRKDEYGQVKLEYVGPENSAGTQSCLSECKYLTVYLHSDTLIRNDFQGYSASLDDFEKALEKRLEIELCDVPDGELTNGEGRHFVRTGRRESWHKGWGMPRPSLVYFQAGSVFLFKVKNPESWDEQKARDLIETGIGDRRAEGYGRILFNPPFCASSNVQEAERKKEDEQKTEKNCLTRFSSDLGDFIVNLEREFLKKRFRQAVRCDIYGKDETVNKQKSLITRLLENKPSNSQCGALREAAVSIKDGENGLLSFKHWLAINEEKRNGDKKFLNPLWLKELNKLVENPYEIGTSKNQLGNYALRTFIDILCEAVFDAEKQEKQNKQKNNSEVESV